MRVKEFFNRLLIGYVRFIERTEYLILNCDTIRWTVQGRNPVRISWSQIREVRSIRWCDWIILITNERWPVYYVPARFRPRGMQIKVFAKEISQYWKRYK